MDLINNWANIRAHFNKSFRSSLHVSIASIDSNNHPLVTPIGTLFLNKDHTGFYFEKFPKKLPKYHKEQPRICVLGVNSSKWFWLKSLFYGNFEAYPGLKLYGKLGVNRKATAIEISRLNRRMKATSWMKGHQYLWSDMDRVREIKFDKAEQINIGEMTDNLS